MHFFAGSATCYVRAVAEPQSVVLASDGLVAPAPYLALLACGFGILIHWPPFAACADVWYSGEGLLGFEPSDAPRGLGRRRSRWAAFQLLLLSFLCASVGSSCLFVAVVVLRVDGSGGSAATGPITVDFTLSNAERCYVVWGLGEDMTTDHTDRPGASRPCPVRPQPVPSGL